MVFHALTFTRSRGRCWKPRPEAAVFNTSQGTWRVLMHWKNMFSRYYCIKIEKICYISRYFLHYFVSPLRRCLANVISTDYAPLCNNIQERLNKLRYGINTIIKCGIWQPVKFQIVSHPWTGSKMNDFFHISELTLPFLIQFKNKKLTVILQAVRCHILWSY